MLKCHDNSHVMNAAGPTQAHRFNPYEDNGGSLAAICGEGFVVIGGDTRLSSGFNILTRKQSKLFKLENNSVLAVTGCWCDSLTFAKYVEARLKMYNYEHDQHMSTTAVAQCCSTMLYGRRFFPYYVSTVVAGLNEQGNGVAYHYDPVGSMEPLQYTAGGSSSPLMLPLLDSIVGKKNQENPDKTPLTKDQAVALVKDVFISAAERDIHCGDTLHYMIITKDGIEEGSFELRKD